ncbi:septal ring lytic transglycosylase RlpA family protein [Agrobacterium sp. a22-2]|uniref:septal ring lytic transglycosylase RlpA family protein n=1 Tax=Agrobacterium sp. a22-2 TaxID=2283840 RepID=UPI00144553C0|nr:septal ring lytic transglycosylase RlpA family protein [Agrobacterium sp. a22-2]NKN37661.1 septal ring lytic transglycosylase RlpA family protein [Agrobacterium sp. a22-2]
MRKPTLKACRASLTVSARLAVVAVLGVSAAACTSTTHASKSGSRSKEYFAESEYGVKASPRVTTSGAVPKGGGRAMVGKPYQVRGKTYVPKLNPDYDKTGYASWYGSAFHGRRTANGEVYDQYHLSAAHPTMPLPSYARVTNQDTGASVIVRVNDRGPFHSDRIIDVSDKTAEMLDMKAHGTAKVRVQYVGPADMSGHDMPFLMASYVAKGSRFPQTLPEGQIASGVMVASAGPVQMPAQTFEAQSAALPGVATSAVPSSTMALQATPTQSPAFDAITQFVVLPEFGPMLIERPIEGPGGRQGGASYASAYIDPGSISSDGLAFDAILVRNDGLTPAAILHSAKRRAAD